MFKLWKKGSAGGRVQDCPRLPKSPSYRRIHGCMTSHPFLCSSVTVLWLATFQIDLQALLFLPFPLWQLVVLSPEKTTTTRHQNNKNSQTVNQHSLTNNSLAALSLILINVNRIFYESTKGMQGHHFVLGIVGFPFSEILSCCRKQCGCLSRKIWVSVQSLPKVMWGGRSIHAVFGLLFF